MDPDQESNPTSKFLIEMAFRCAVPYTSLPAARAAMVSGSAAEGVSDYYSDIDMMIYYSELPAQVDLDKAKSQNRGGERLWQFGSKETGSIIESYQVEGIECQFAHATIPIWEAHMASFVYQLTIAPISLNARIEMLLAAEPRDAASLLGVLVNETVSLVEEHMPLFDTSSARRQIEREFNPWKIPER